MTIRSMIREAKCCKTCGRWRISERFPECSFYKIRTFDYEVCDNWISESLRIHLRNLMRDKEIKESLGEERSRH